MKSTPEGPDLETQIGELLGSFVASQRGDLEPLGPDLEPLFDVAAAYVEGGKRIRPLFCIGGWLAAGGDPAAPGIIQAAAALEWLQASALVHDDLMDGSDTRRGRPSAHRQFEALHAARAWALDGEQFGAGAAILLGDLLLSWCDDMFRRANLDPLVLHAAGAVLDLCKSEVAGGQFLDLVAQAKGTNSVEEAERVIRYKSVAYTVLRPLDLGVALAGLRSSELTSALADFGAPLGTAFQLRDDLLGVFGDPQVTGKPAGDDLREGKRTVLVARAAETASAAELRRLNGALGNPALDQAAVDDVRAIMESTGARAAVEREIQMHEATAAQALDDLTVPDGARTFLGTLLDRLTGRTS
ncbi:MAG: polyprenyl synthetase [Nocardioidaceae bacterium]|nr:polyprenyl synthetase [Nocardioidaceae bacterium]